MSFDLGSRLSLGECEQTVCALAHTASNEVRRLHRKSAMSLQRPGDVVAVASRTPERAAMFSAANGVGRAHGSYEALLDDREIDVVYIPLPNSMHAEWATKAAEHGKHMLCEKPLALDAAEAKSRVDAARRHGADRNINVC